MCGKLNWKYLRSFENLISRCECLNFNQYTLNWKFSMGKTANKYKMEWNIK